MDFYSQKTIDTFFQKFYTERIEIVRTVGKSNYKQLDLSLLTFWFFVVDFFGGLCFIRKNGFKKTYIDKTLKLADKETFTLFIRDFFPKPENELGELIYSVFRSGIVHQLSPKKGEILWEASNQKLLWVKIDKDISDNTANKIATLNIFKLEEITYKAFIDFRQKIENNELTVECKNIYNLLLKELDGLGDGITIHTQYDKLNNIIKTQITI